jgi:nucleotide-binding universal stress UspA family protein
MDMPVSANSVVAGVDGSTASVQAAQWAAAAAIRYGLPLQLVHAIPPLPANAYPTMGPNIETLRRAVHQEGEELLDKAAAAARNAAPDVTIIPWQKVGDPVDVLSLASATARVIAVGATGQTGLIELLAGSTALALPAHSHCPVVVVRHRADGTDAADGPVVVGVVGTPLDDPAVAFAFEQASLLGVELIAVHSWSDSALPDIDRITGQHDDWNAIFERERRLLAEGFAGYGERYPEVAVRPIVVYDRPTRALLDHARYAQLLVVGSRGRGRVTGALLGSTSRAVMKLAPCPVAVVARSH